MLQYPSILGVKKFPLGFPCWAFYKYDGSNLRFEWSQKKGWHKFGSRTQMIDINSPIYGEGIEIFLNTMGDIIVQRIAAAYPKQFKNIERITAFAELFGDQSFAGSHEIQDKKQLKLFDIFLFKKGFMGPQEFLHLFDEYDFTAELVYQGNLNHEFIESVRHNALPTKLNEGVICKGLNPKIPFKTYGDVWMTKIKTYEYINKLKNKYQEKWEQFGE